MNQLVSILMVIAILLIGFVVLFFIKFFINKFTSKTLDKNFRKNAFFKNWNLKKEIIVWIISFAIACIIYIIFFFGK